MAIRPIADRVIVEPVKAAEATRHGIIIPENVRHPSQRGIIKAVGTGRVTSTYQAIPMDVKVGDRVLFGRYAGVQIVVDGRDLLMLREAELIAVFDEKKEPSFQD